jgi:hypothetical protein
MGERIEKVQETRGTTLPPGPTSRGGPASLQALQRTAGNAATGKVARQLLQRRGGKNQKADPEAASDDYSDALDYINDFYERVRDSLALHDKVRATAQGNYETFGKLEDPPSLADEIVKAIFMQVLSAVPGWGGVVAKGLEMGIFAMQLGRLKLELDEQPIPGYSVADEERIGPSEATKERAKKNAERVKTGWDTGTKVVETVIDVLAKQKAAADAEKAALESAGLAQQRITDWAAGIAVAQKEEAIVKGWLKKARDDGKNRGRLRALVEQRLGPLVVVDPKLVPSLISHYELALYRAKFGGKHGAGKNVRTVYESPWGDSDPTSPELRVAGGLSQATRRQIAKCAGVSATDDQTMAKVLGVQTVVERKRNPGLKRPGEM